MVVIAIAAGVAIGAVGLFVTGCAAILAAAFGFYIGFARWPLLGTFLKGDLIAFERRLSSFRAIDLDDVSQRDFLISPILPTLIKKIETLQTKINLQSWEFCNNSGHQLNNDTAMSINNWSNTLNYHSL